MPVPAGVTFAFVDGDVAAFVYVWVRTLVVRQAGHREATLEPV